MRRNADPPIELTSCFTETEAAILISKLDAEGIEARMIGGLTSGLRAEAPGGVKILVRETDLERARLVIERIDS